MIILHHFRGRHVRRCEDYTRARKSEFVMECPKDRDAGCLTVFQGPYLNGMSFPGGRQEDEKSCQNEKLISRASDLTKQQS